MQPVLHGHSHQLEYSRKTTIFSKYILRKKYLYKNTDIFIQINFFYQLTFALFIMACLCAASFLPYGRFYNRLGGNIGMLGSYIYIFMYLAFNGLRRSNMVDLYLYRAIHRLNSLGVRLKPYLKSMYKNTPVTPQ
jgi:hypothetical protein